MNDSIWKYLIGRHTKHYFYSNEQATAVCGYSQMWYNSEKWKDDEQGLNSRKKCGRCLRILRRQT